MSKKKPKKKTESEPVPHPIGVAITEFDHAVLDIEACAFAFVPIALKSLADGLNTIMADVDQAILEAEKATKEKRPAAYTQLSAAFAKQDRLTKNKIPYRLQECLFIGLFSAYDAYFGNLLRILFQKRPKLCECFQGEVKTSEILRFDNIDQLKTKILDDYVDDTRRKGYVDQFSQLEGAFSVQLKKFSNWPKFIEAAQRRNLFTHCDGIVSQQYLSVCEANGYKFQEGKTPKVGERLGIDFRYFMETCHVIQEVGIKLAHTLWRKLFEEELETADQQLSDLVYQYLKNGKPKPATIFGEFAYTQKKISTDQWKLIFTVNYCIGLSHSGSHEKCAEIIGALDLSTALPEFKLARAVLVKDFKLAAAIMKKIGRSGEIVDELSYSSWPLFRDFRGSSQFQKAYKEIYGYDFLTEIKKVAKAKRTSALKMQKSLTVMSVPLSPNANVPAEPTEVSLDTA